MGNLDQRVAIVTGGGSGIGRNIAIEFSKAGADIVVCGRTLSNLEKVAEEIRSTGRRALAVSADVSVAKQVNNMVKQTMDTFGRIDILVNNAGLVHRALIVDMSEEDWDRLMGTNLKGVLLCIQAVAGYMMQKRYGKIINIASVAGMRAGSALAAYGTSKAGVVHLTRTAALELGPHGINVNSISPGLIDTDIYKRIRTPEEVKEFEEETIKATFMARLGKTQDIARTALFLVSEDASFISGQNIVIDGGR